MAFNVGALTATLGFRVDDDGAERFERKIKTLRGEAARPVTAELRGDLNPRDLDLYDKKLNELRAKVSRRDAFKAQLGANYDPKAFNAMERDLHRLDRQTDNTVRSQGRLRTAFGSVSSAGVGMFAAAGGGYAVYQGLKGITTASGDAEASMAKVRVMVNNAGIDFDKHAKQIDKTIQAHSRLSGFDDEDLAESFGNMIRTTGNLNEAFRLNAIAADIARSKGTDLAASQSLVARVSNGAFMGLKRLGLAIDPITKAQDALRNSTKKYTTEQMRAAVEADKTATSRKAIALLEKTFAGQAEAYGRTQTGALDKVKVAWENLQETLGEKLAPTITKVANTLAKFIGEMTDGTGQGGEFVDTLKDIGSTLKDIGGFIKDHITLIKLAAGAWVGYKAAALAGAAASRIAAASAAAGGAGAAAKAGAGSALGRIGRSLPLIATGIVIASEVGKDRGHSITVDEAREDIDKLIQSSHGLDDARKKLAQFAADFRRIAAMPGKPDSWRDHYNGIAEAAEDASKRMTRAFEWATGEMRSSFHNLRKNTNADLSDIDDVVDRSMARIRKNLDTDSDEGRKAIAENFRHAVQAVRRQMKAGEITTRDGMKAIRGYLTEELQVYGLSLRQAKNIAKGGAGGGQFGDPDANRGREGGAFNQRGGRVGRQEGGWLGRKGDVGADTIPVAPGYWAAPGEFYAKGPGGQGAVINRHQAPLVNLALMRGGYTLDTLPTDQSALPRIEAALRDVGGLDAIFSSIRRPHMLQSGGMIAAANRVERAHFPYLWGGGHQGSPAPFGPFDCSGAVSYVLQQGGVKIPTMTAGLLMNAGKPGPGPVTVFANQGHTFMRIGNRFFGTSGTNPGGGAGWFPNPGAGYLSRFVQRHFNIGSLGGFGGTIPRLRIRGGGAVGGLAQAALDMARGGANRVLNAALMAGVGTGDPGDPGPGGAHAGANKAIARGLLGAYGWGPGQFPALDSLWTGESGWDENIVNPSSGAGGIPQALPASKMGPGWQGNALQQIRWGLRYIKSRYGSPTAAYSAWLSRSPHWYQGGGHINVGSGRAPGHGRGHHTRRRPRRLTPAQRRGIHNRELRNLIGFSDIFEQNIALAELTPATTDDLFWLRAAESVYDQIVKKGVRYGRRDLAAQYAPTLISTRAAIDEILHPDVIAPETSGAPSEVTRPPSPEEIAQGVASQLASFNAARSSLFSTYGSNYTLAGGALVPNSAAGLMHFGALSSGAGSPNTATRVINQTNVFPTPPPEPHLFARLMLHDLQAAP